MYENTLLKKKENFFKRNLFVIIAFFATAILMTLVYFCFDMVPFGDITILRMDLYHQYGPLFGELLDRIKNGETFLYSFNSGMGSSFLGNFFNYLSSPLSWLVILFKHVDITDFIALIVLLKASLSSSAFAYYLKKNHNRNDLSIAAFGIMYSFCGYFIAYYWNVMWIDAMYILPFVILGIENIINKGKPFCFITALTIMFFSSYYMAFMICIFSVIYFIAYYFMHYNATSIIRTKPEGRLKFSEKIKNFFASRFINSGVTFAFSAILSAALAACALVPVYFILKNCSATSGTFPEEFKTYFNVFDFLANHIASVTPTIRSSGDVVLPNVYCGIAALILVPLFAFTKTISKKEKIISLSLLVVIFVSFNTNYLNYIWHGLHFPNDLPYRFSFIYSFILLTIAYKALMRIKEVGRNVIMGVGVSLIAFIIATQKIESHNV
ncbi:MAG: YfhO family protein, partial [Clostridia bacterium]|nr:YfhO family protein [Clostridia bacterium]